LLSGQEADHQWDVVVPATGGMMSGLLADPATGRPGGAAIDVAPSEIAAGT
jgi:hypothetical protein